ncbi:hypothetical protein [Helicobacter cappadocius]|uniref:Uncharacterized protein n=1 Tax=Helicobacter cappadocius TaxID=3063998 RepID=A0AA90PUM7_9HELI|nr:MULTISPECIES: hypothetical protein [unclassified Helicobacter]MDO7252872.1 hypothetical protein [Helicobacter sp. faydin-H75]MDP2538915.1 hypothetical protein [Helicobacter sp. faydin-H76]
MKKILLFVLLCFHVSTALENKAVDKKISEHQRTYGVVFLVPKETVSKILEISGGKIQEALLQNNLIKETLYHNIPHISVIHIHNPDPNTPYNILKSLPKPPKPFTLSLEHYGFIKASPNASFPWWLEINVGKNLDYKIISEYNFKVTQNIAPLRSSPLPRLSGYIYEDLSADNKSQILELGSNSLNRIKNGKKEEYYRPHMTLSYSQTPLNKTLSDSMKELQRSLNKEFETPIITKIDTISIVELGFLGNVLREIYRINLNNGKIFDVQKGKFIKIKTFK